MDAENISVAWTRIITRLEQQMADASLSTIYQFTLIQEEGRQSAPLDGDPGGATNYGITIATLSAWLGRPADPHEVYGLTLGEAEIILQAWYYRGMGGNTMPAGVDLMQTDHAFNCGVTAAKTITRTIQRGLGAEPDGIAGPITAQAAGGVVALLLLLRSAHEADYRAKANFTTFGHEWIGDPTATTDWKRQGRLGRRYAAALKLATT